MPALADLERLLERLFERTTARVFRAHVQVVQVEHRVERAMERARVQQGSWSVVPSRYRVRLNPDDVSELAAAAGSPEALAGRLADSALAFARAHGYHLSGRPSVAIVADPGVERSGIEVDAVADRSLTAAHPQPADAIGGHGVPDTPEVGPREDGPSPSPSPSIDGGAFSAQGPGMPEAAPAAGTPSTAGALPGGSPDAVGRVQPLDPGSAVAGGEPVGAGVLAGTGPAGAPPPPEPPPQPESIRREGTETLVFRKPVPPEVRAILRVTAADGRERLVEVGGAPVTLGRSTDNALVLADSRVSRHHGRLQARRGTLVYADLGSTNGSRVNGVRVDECVLGMGDRIVVGDTVLLVEQLPG